MTVLISFPSDLFYVLFAETAMVMITIQTLFRFIVSSRAAFWPQSINVRSLYAAIY